MARNKKRILMVDDDPELAELYREILEENLFSFKVAGDAAEGLRLARKFKPDLILLDLMLPMPTGVLRPLPVGCGPPSMP